jgi:hypothetical protein
MSRKKKPAKKSAKSKEKDVRGYIVRPLNASGKPGHAERGHLEGADAMSALPPDVLRDLKRALKSGKAQITIEEHAVGDDETEFGIEINSKKRR